MNLETAESAEFPSIIEQIWEFLEHPLQAFLNETKSTRKWIPQKGWR
jgi:hypothetical protein